MLDPREQAKQGFGAFVAREQERHDRQEAAKSGEGMPPVEGDADTQEPDALHTGTPESAADGER